MLLDDSRKIVRGHEDIEAYKMLVYFFQATSIQLRRGKGYHFCLFILIPFPYRDSPLTGKPDSHYQSPTNI